MKSLMLLQTAVVLLNVDGFFDGLATFVDNAIASGFIAEKNRPFMTFLSPPSDGDWGKAALAKIDDWHANGSGGEAFALKWT